MKILLEEFKRIANRLVRGRNRAAGRRLAETQEKLREVRQRLREKDQEITRLQTKLAKSRLVHRSDAPVDTVFFVIGPPKSGTSWIQGALSLHPEIFCSGEGKFFGRDFKNDNPYGQWGATVSFAMSGSNRTADRGSLHSALVDSEDLKRWFRSNGGWTGEEDIGIHTKALVRLTMDHLFQEAAVDSGKRIVGDKSPSHIQYLEEIHELYPEARIIHVIRDGRDQAVSSVFHWWRHARDRGGFFPLTMGHSSKRDAYYNNRENFGPGKESIFDATSLEALAASWRKTVSSALAKGPRLFGDRYVEVRYEDLLIHPEELFADMVRFLGANAEENIIKEMVGKTRFERVSGNRSVGVEDPESFYRKGLAGDWKNYFIGPDRQVYKREAGDLLVELGYERDHSW